MPTQIKELPKVERGRTSKYDFSALFDGKPYVLVQGTKEEVAEGKADFSCQPASIRQTVYTEARNQDLALSTRNLTHEGRKAIAIQVTGPYEPKAKQNGKGGAKAKAE